MKTILTQNPYFFNMKDICIEKNNKNLQIFHDENGNLCFDVIGNSLEERENLHTEFVLTEEDDLYQYFKNLIKVIREAEVYVPSDEQLELIDDSYEFHELLAYYKNKNKKLKNSPIYNSIVRNNNIKIYSDSNTDEEANSMIIESFDNKIKISFYDNLRDSMPGFIVKIGESNSKYNPFNICFMRFFNKLHEDLTKTKQENKVKKIGTI